MQMLSIKGHTKKIIDKKHMIINVVTRSLTNLNFMIKMLKNIETEGAYFDIRKTICHKYIDVALLNRKLLKAFVLESGVR